jgi:hypothetical protein
MNKKIRVNNSIQKNYTYYLTEPIGKNFNKNFKPDLTPKQMLELGVFDGFYVDNTYTKEFPKSWFTKAKLAKNGPDEKLNYFKVHASQPLEVWQKKGWIHKDDPRGWFEWYCRYYMGRRNEDDERQIKRWGAIARHIGQVKKNCRPGDIFCRPRQRQALLHWAYDSRKM